MHNPGESVWKTHYLAEILCNFFVNTECVDVLFLFYISLLFIGKFLVFALLSMTSSPASVALDTSNVTLTTVTTSQQTPASSTGLGEHLLAGGGGGGAAGACNAKIRRTQQQQQEDIMGRKKIQIAHIADERNRQV